jgi:hypothetical protein
LACQARTMGPVKLKLDLHDIYNRGEEIERALRSIMDEAVAKKRPSWRSFQARAQGSLRTGCFGSWTAKRSRRATLTRDGRPRSDQCLPPRGHRHHRPAQLRRHTLVAEGRIDLTADYSVRNAMSACVQFCTGAARHLNCPSRPGDKPDPGRRGGTVSVSLASRAGRSFRAR